MASASGISTQNQQAQERSGSAGKYLANLLYLATILLVLGFIWQSIAPVVRPFS